MLHDLSMSMRWMLAVAAVIAPTAVSVAQDAYPSRPVRIIPRVRVSWHEAGTNS